MPGWLRFLAKCFIFSPHSLSLEVIPRIPHTYIILYRAIYLIPVYICITGATYIHTKNKAGDDRLQQHGSGKTSVINIHGHSPHLGSLLPLQPCHQHPDSAGLARQGEGQGEERCMPQLSGRGWAVAARTGSPQPRVPVISSHTRNSCLRGNKRYSILSVSPPTPHH